MACLLAARLVDGAGPPLCLSMDIRRSRASGAQAWLASHQMSARLRSAFERLIDATAGADPVQLGRPLRAVLEMAAPRLDESSRAELSALLDRVG